MKQSALIIKAVLVLAFSTFMMANTQCQQPVAEQRQLKKNIKLVQLDASTFLDNSGFSFSEVARSQFSGVLFEKNNFFERNIYPSANSLSGASDQNFFHVQKTSVVDNSIVQMKAWFPELKSQEILLNRESSCFIEKPQHYLFGKINSLEAYSGAALQFGFNQSIAPVVPISANFKMDKMRMDLSFHAIDPWTQQVVASANSEAFKKDYKVGFGIDLGIFHIGPEFYRVTGMAEVILKGLQNATQDLAKLLFAQPRQEWSTRIMYSRDNYVVILGGAELGLKKGDKLKVFNEVHTWIGQACGESSILAGSVIVSDVNDPWIVEIEDAGNLMSKAKVLNIKENDSINTGALVQLHSFVAPPVVVAKP
ncbi:MAG: hypothetical protein WA160_09780 [Pseudobdellovibrio sp.]